MEHHNVQMSKKLMYSAHHSRTLLFLPSKIPPLHFPLLPPPILLFPLLSSPSLYSPPLLSPPTPLHPSPPLASHSSLLIISPPLLFLHSLPLSAFPFFLFLFLPSSLNSLIRLEFNSEKCDYYTELDGVKLRGHSPKSNISKNIQYSHGVQK